MSISKWFGYKGGTFPHVTASGHEYFWHYKPRSKNSPARSELRVERNLRWEFTIQPESFITRFIKKLGFATEFQTHDGEFDSKYYILSDDPQFCSKLRTISIRESVKKIFGLGVEELKVSKGRWSACMKDAMPTPDKLFADPIAETIHEIADQLAHITPDPSSPGKSMAGQAKIVVWFLIGLLVVSLMASTMGRHLVATKIPLIKSAAMYAVPVIIAMIVIVRAQFSGSSHGVSVFLAAIFAGIPAICFSSYSAHYYANIYMDKSVSQLYYARILGTHISRHKNSTSYYVEVENWQNPAEKINVRTSYPEYSQARPGGTMVLNTHPGYLGVGWIESYRL